MSEKVDIVSGPAAAQAAHRMTAKDFGEVTLRVDSAAAIGTPTPVGLFAFGLTLIQLSFFYAGFVEPAFGGIVFAFAFALGGIVLLMVGQWEMYKKNTFAATAFTVFGGFWLGLAVWFHAGLAWPAANPALTKGFTAFLSIWGIFSFVLFLLTLVTNFALCFTFFTLTLTFFLLVGGQYTPGALTAGGYVGIICSLAAMYTGAAVLAAEMLGREVLPVGPMAGLWSRKVDEEKMV
ncbi:GPR1/FUN34/yaaH family-domain-containing protein [Hyaloraphidium curvatum]|nr:GPR1/FUN34/yaaH family-domain-containing protein [Hyaloraphidium curvatum]